MPRIHLGVYLMSGTEAANATKWALEVSLGDTYADDAS